MVFQGLDQKEAEDIWRPLLHWVVASTNDLAIVYPIRILAAPARRRWDPEYLKQDGLVLQDDRPGASPANVAESDYFEAEWQRSFWGQNYQRLLAIKERYDPEGLFFVHHGVGAERWSPDGFRRIS